jgi:predicted nucleic acid-binding protein
MAELERIVINTGPLIALSEVERLDILDALYDDVLVPQQVHDEVLQGAPWAEICPLTKMPTFCI